MGSHFLSFKRLFVLFFLVFSFFSLEAQSKPAPWVKIKPDAWPTLEHLQEGDKKDLLTAIDQSLNFLSRSASKFHYPLQGITHKQLQKTLWRFSEILNSDLDAKATLEQIKKEFDLYKVGQNGEKKPVLFTGYYEVFAKGSREKTEEFKYPLYAVPQDLHLSKTGKVLGRKTKSGELVSRYWTRKEIDHEGQLKGQGLEIVYLKEPYNAYMAHLQGSITIELPCKNKIHLGYAARNCSTVGFSLPKELHKAGVFEKNELLPQKIKSFFLNKPEELSKYLLNNPTYVFFKERKVAPIGSLCVRLTPKRSISLDQKVYPKGALAFLDLSYYKQKKNHDLKFFVLNQDTGGGIRGAHRCDFFFGIGDEAEQLACDLYTKGDLYFLLLKESL